MATLSTSRSRNPLLQRLDDLESSPEWLNLASSISELTLTPARSPDGSHLPRRARVTKSLEFPRKNPPKPSDCTYCVSDSLTSDPIKNHHEIDMETLAKKNTDSRTLNEKQMDFDIESTSEEIRQSRERLHEIFEHNRMLRRRFFEDQNAGDGRRFGSTETLGSNSNQSGASPDLGYIDHQKSINLSIEKQDGGITEFGAKIESLNREIKELDAANNKWHHFQQDKQNKMAASDEVDFSGKFKNSNDNITDSIDFYGEKWQWDHFNDIKRPKLTSTSESHSEKYHCHIFDIDKNYKMATIDGAGVIEGKENLTNLTETNEHLNDKIHNTDESHCDKWPGEDLKSPQLVSSFSNSVIEVNCEYGNDYWRSVQQPGNGSTLPFVYGPMPYKSPRRYVESEVTIHYRSPVRTEAKEILSEEELARRSAENMRRIYQEERRRKYLQELHDIDSRRHTDNFTPSQKSPIPLNRYDDFMDDSSYRSRSQEHTPEPRLLARALYNFVGQTSRELSFRRGDIIVIRRQIDKNWYEGEHNAMIGLFPLNYVEILPYDSSRGTPKKSYEGQARAKFNFLAQTNLELSLAKGELVVLTRRVDENWFEGRIGNKKGIFPVSYVEVICEPGQHRPETPVSSKPVASPAAHSLLSNGTSSGKLSMGPHHYVPSMPVKTSSSSEPQYISLPRIGVTERNKLHVAPVNETLHIDTHSDSIPYRALYNYRPQNEDELELKEGDTVYVMEKCDDGWYVGSSQRTGYFGTFPGNYVERL